MNYMSANPDLAKSAIQQMMTWEGQDATYNFRKGTTGLAWVNAGKDPTQFNYGGVFPRPSVDKPLPNARPIEVKPSTGNDAAAGPKAGEEGYKGTTKAGHPYTVKNGTSSI